MQRTARARAGGSAVAVAIALSPLLAACGEDEQPADTGAVEEPARDELTDLAIGETVTVDGEVCDVVDGTACTLGADVPALEEDDDVRVAGTVTHLQVAGFEEDLDLDLADDEFEDFDGDLAIAATSVTAP